VNLLIGALIFLPFLTMIIAIHEAGHFVAARHFGMKVTEYFIGFGPRRIWARRTGELEYGVKPIWIGGYVKIAGMNPFEEDPPEDAPRLYGAKPIWQRAITIFAGPGTHFVVAAVIFALGFFLFGDVTSEDAIVTVGSVERSIDGLPAPARVAGMQPGDRIVGVGTQRDPSDEELIAALTEQAQQRRGQPIDLAIERAGREVVLGVTPVLTRDDQGARVGRIGVELEISPRPLALGGAIVDGVTEVPKTIVESGRQIARVFSPSGIGRTFGLLFNDERRDPSRDPTSVVGVSEAVGAVGSAGAWADLFYVFGFVTVFIGLINLLPLPPFDGGHLLVLAIEKLRGGKPVDMRALIPVSATVMAFFVTFVTATVLLDITKPIGP
jgi:membrane-associated protease RseP (regulator of RpoE activity)